MARLGVWLDSLGNKFYVAVLIFFAVLLSIFGYIFSLDIPIWRAVLSMAIMYILVIFICTLAIVATSTNGRPK